MVRISVTLISKAQKTRVQELYLIELMRVHYATYKPQKEQDIMCSKNMKTTQKKVNMKLLKEEAKISKWEEIKFQTILDSGYKQQRMKTIS